MGVFELLLNPDVLKIIGPFGILVFGLSFALWKVFKLYAEAQEKRIQEAQQFQKEYFDLANDINKTMDLLLSAVLKKKD